MQSLVHYLAKPVSGRVAGAFVAATIGTFALLFAGIWMAIAVTDL